LKKRLRAIQIRNELKEDALTTERKKWTVGFKIWIYFVRIFTTLLNLSILAVCMVAIVLAATEGKELAQEFEGVI